MQYSYYFYFLLLLRFGDRFVLTVHSLPSFCDSEGCASASCCSATGGDTLPCKQGFQHFETPLASDSSFDSDSDTSSCPESAAGTTLSKTSKVCCVKS